MIYYLLVMIVLFCFLLIRCINLQSLPKGTDKLASDLKALWRSGDGSDLTITVKGVEFKCHRIILRARTPNFVPTLGDDWISSVSIAGCLPETFKAFLQYVYTGTAKNLSPETVCNLYEMADKYKVDELKAQCVECMELMLSVETFCDVMGIAAKYDEKSLTEIASNFLSRNMKAIIATDKWQHFSTEYPKESNKLLIGALGREEK